MIETYASMLVDAGEKMRSVQKDYFTARQKAQHKTAISLLSDLKRREKEFDALLVSAKTQIESSRYISKSFDLLAEDPEAKP
jgi:hypothetical protein